jgi:integrase
MTIPTADDVGGAMRAAHDQFSAFIAVCAFAGLRRGEVSALQVSDVDFLRKEIRVSRQVQWTDDGRMELRPPKYGSERTVYIPDGLVTMLAEYVRLYRPGDDPDRWLFPGSRDAQLPAHAATVARSWRIVRDEVAIPYRLHDLRHFYASGLIRAGCDVVTVQRALGHSSAAITLTTYSHLWPDANDRTRRAAGKLLDQSLGATADPLRTESKN